MKLPRFFMRHVEPEPNSGCWLWTGYRNQGGYGVTSLDGQARLAHRVSYEVASGPVPEGLELDHLCRTRPCVNPTHLEAVTRAVNIRRGDKVAMWMGAPRSQSVKTHCPSGHAYSESNTSRDAKNRRKCRECRRARARSRYWASRKRQRTTAYGAA